MDILYSTDHMTELLIQADTTRNIEEPQQKYRLGTASNALLAGRGELKHVLIQTLALSFYNGSKHLVRMKVF